MKHTLSKSPQKAAAARPELHHDLKHILSPLEQAALKHHYKPFVYDYEGISIYISRHACKQLMQCATDKISFLTSLIEQERLSTGIPVKHREAFGDPRLILSLPPRLRNRLIRLGCHSLFIVMQKGRGYFEEQGFSPLAMRRLEGLFGEYGCEGVFK